jgi:hypothetical protein
MQLMVDRSWYGRYSRTRYAWRTAHSPSLFADEPFRVAALIAFLNRRLPALE